MAPSAQHPARHPVQLAGAAVAAGAAALYVRGVDPSAGGWFPSCPLRSLTGAWCPLCGMTRATHHVLNGELMTALRFNLFVVPALVLLGVVWIGWVRAADTGPSPPRRAVVWTAVVGAAVFTVARNIPALDALRGLEA